MTEELHDAVQRLTCAYCNGAGVLHSVVAHMFHNGEGTYIRA